MQCVSCIFKLITFLRKCERPRCSAQSLLNEKLSHEILVLVTEFSYKQFNILSSILFSPRNKYSPFFQIPNVVRIKLIDILR